MSRFCADKRVVVLGGAGFLGSFIVEKLARRGAGEGLPLAAERYDASEPVDLGSAFEIPIKELTECIAAAIGFMGNIVWDTSKPNGQLRRKVDVSRVEWYLAYQMVRARRDGCCTEPTKTPRTPKRLQGGWNAQFCASSPLGKRTRRLG